MLSWMQKIVKILLKFDKNLTKISGEVAFARGVAARWARAGSAAFAAASAEATVAHVAAMRWPLLS